MTDMWDSYKLRQSKGTDTTRRINTEYNRNFYKRHLPRSLSYKTVVVNGVSQNVAIVDTADFDIKTIFAMPGETIEHGALVVWQDTHWLITDVDMHSEIYTRGKIRRCNYVLKWLDEAFQHDTLIEQPCVIVDNSTLLGEKSNDLMTIGDARTTLLIGKNHYTQKFRRGSRFLIDDPDSVQTLAYEITKPNRMYRMFDGRGVYQFLLHEVNTTNADNLELGVADYYAPNEVNNDVIPDDKGWL